MNPHVCYVAFEPFKGAPTTNRVHVLLVAAVSSLRGQGHDDSLDMASRIAPHVQNTKYGFETLKAAENLLRQFEHAVEAFRKQVLGAEKVVVVDEEVSCLRLHPNEMCSRVADWVRYCG